MKNLKAILIFSILLLIGCANSNLQTKNNDFQQNITANLLIKSDFPIKFFEIGKNSYLIVNNDIFIVKNGKKQSLLNLLPIFTDEIVDVKYFYGKYYIYSHRGVFAIDENNFKMEAYYSANEKLSSDYVNNLWSNGDILIIATDNGLTLHVINNAYITQFENYKEGRAESGWYTFNTNNSPILSNNVLNCYINDSDMLIITDKGLTIYHWQYDYFENYSNDKFFNNQILNQVLEKNGTYYFTTPNSLYAYNVLTKEWRSYPLNSFSNQAIINKIVSNTDKLYFLSPNMIYDFNINSETYEPIVESNTFFNNNFLDIAYNNGLYIATDNGLYILNEINGVEKTFFNGSSVNMLKKKGNNIYCVKNNEIYLLK